MTTPLRALTLVLALLSGVAALPSPEAPTAADSSALLQKTNLFGFVERQALPLPPPSSGQDFAAEPARAREAWDPLNLPAGFVVASSPSPPTAMRPFRNRAAARLVNTERELRWTPAPEDGGEGSGEEPGEQMAEGDEEEEEMVEDDEEEEEGGDEGDMLGEEGWFRTRRVKRSAHVGGVERVVRTRRSWKS